MPLFLTSDLIKGEKGIMAYIKVKDRRRLERKEFRDYIKLSDDKVLDTEKNNIGLLGDDEIFVQLEDTQHYWISNYADLIKKYFATSISGFVSSCIADPSISYVTTVQCTLLSGLPLSIL